MINRNMSLNIHVCGSRGSFPQSDPDHIRYGLNTTCFYLDCGVHLFFDAGSGIIGGSGLVTDSRPVHIILSHVHADHIMGLFEFPLLYDPQREVHIYGENRNGRKIREQLDSFFGPPYWPVTIGSLPAQIHFHEIREGERFTVGSALIVSKRSRHPDLSLLFRLECDHKTLGLAYDHEIGMDPDDMTVSFFKACDLLVFDGNDLPGYKKEGWGHSTWEEGISFMKEAQIRRVLITHYGFGLNDDVLEEEERKAKEVSDACIFAREGMVIEV